MKEFWGHHFLTLPEFVWVLQKMTQKFFMVFFKWNSRAITWIMEERHKNWSRELSKSFIVKSPFIKKPNLLHWKTQSKWTLFSFYIISISFYMERCLYPSWYCNNMRLHIFQYVLNNTYNLRNIFFLQSER